MARHFFDFLGWQRSAAATHSIALHYAITPTSALPRDGYRGRVVLRLAEADPPLAATLHATRLPLQLYRQPCRLRCGLDSAGDTPAATDESAYPFFRLAQYDYITNLITRHRVLLRTVRRHRQPIEVVIEQPIPAGKVGVPVNSHQLVIISKMIGHALRLFSEVETMQN